MRMGLGRCGGISICLGPTNSSSVCARVYRGFPKGKTGVMVFAPLLLLAGLSLAAPQSNGLNADQLKQLDAFIEKSLATYKIPGAAVALIQDGKVVLMKGYGVREIGKSDKVDENTLFQLASVTKTFTGGSVGAMVDAGKLKWEEPICNILPEFRFENDYVTRWCTERDLLTHTTGWPEFGGDMVDPFGYSRSEIIHRLRYFNLVHSFRETTGYSNPGFFIAGEVAAKAAGMSWNDLVQSKLLNPLAMKRTYTRLAGLSDSNFTKNHYLDNGKVALCAPDNQDTMASAGAMISCASDMTHWMQMLLDRGTYNGTTVLKPETVDTILSRAFATPPSISELPPIGPSTGFFYGMGWGGYDFMNHLVVEKGGALSGVRTIVEMVPDMKTGMVVLCNLNLNAFPEAVRAYWLDLLFGVNPDETQAAILKTNTNLENWLVPPTPPANPAPFLGTLESLVGTYENDYYGKFSIELKSGSLMVYAGPARYEGKLVHWNAGNFMMKFPGPTQGFSSTTFAIGDSGKADQFVNEAFGVFKRVGK